MNRHDSVTVTRELGNSLASVRRIDDDHLVAHRGNVLSAVAVLAYRYIGDRHLTTRNELIRKYSIGEKVDMKSDCNLMTKRMKGDTERSKREVFRQLT